MNIAHLSLWIIGTWVGGLLLLFIVGKVLSALTLRSVNRGSGDQTVGETERALKRIYRAVIHLAAGYYYISLPVIALIIIALIVALFYGFYEAGRINIKIALMVLAGGGLTLYKMITSFLLEIPDQEPGRELKQEEAPGLWELTREVAADVDTRPIDEIRITPGTEVAVYERGTKGEKKDDSAKRVLLLGLGILYGFREPGFRAVLAHEYGHFTHRDTAGGDVALTVQREMFKYFIGLYQAGQAVFWNLAFQFLRLYSLLFRRISHGATRLQEIMADRVAARLYGAPAFESGLTHVIQRSIEFGIGVKTELARAASEKRQVNNLYALLPVSRDDIRPVMLQAINAETTADDTHPAPLDRFRFIAPYQTAQKQVGDRLILDLFVDREAITAEMTAAIEEAAREPRIRPSRREDDENPKWTM